MKRRTFVTGLAAGAVWPFATRAQQRSRIPSVGLLFFESEGGISRDGAAFLEAMRALGWIEQRTVSYEFRYARGDSDRLAAMAAELASARMDVIVCFGTQATQAARKASATLPIVMAGVRDPVGSGLVASLARPGGNVTGTSLMLTDVGSKHVELLRETVPRLKRLGLLLRQGYAAHDQALPGLKTAASGFGVEVETLSVASVGELPDALERFATAKVEAMLVLANPHIDEMRGRIAALALERRIAAMGQFREYAQAGFLLSYAVSLPQAQGRAAAYADRILRGARPDDLPVEQPTKLELVVNVKTAKALGLAIPDSILLRADEVIE